MDFDLAAAVAVLERTPRTVRAMLDGLAPAWTDATEGPDTWSPRVVVGHLIHGERTDWIPRARIILAQGQHRRFEPFDRFAQHRNSQGSSLATLLDDFTTLRAQSLATLDEWRVSEAQLALEGEHPEFGTVTLRQLLATWVAHDLGHIAQIARVMAKQYRGAVGPWRAYLSVLNR
ncbi:MAG TPA: DinB family protein [Gemmatimonadaceae bacterium]